MEEPSGRGRPRGQGRGREASRGRAWRGVSREEERAANYLRSSDLAQDLGDVEPRDRSEIRKNPRKHSHDIEREIEDALNEVYDDDDEEEIADDSQIKRDDWLNRFKGKIKKWDTVKGFGFAEYSEGRIFIHSSSICSSKRDLSVGEEIEFNITSTDKGAAASNVTLLNEALKEIDELKFNRAIILRPGDSVVRKVVSLSHAGVDTNLQLKSSDESIRITPNKICIPRFCKHSTEFTVECVNTSTTRGDVTISASIVKNSPAKPKKEGANENIIVSGGVFVYKDRIDGKVVDWDNQKGYGKICAHGMNVFFHWTSMFPRWGMAVGEDVECEIELNTSGKGLKAVRILRLKFSNEIEIAKTKRKILRLSQNEDYSTTLDIQLNTVPLNGDVTLTPKCDGVIFDPPKVTIKSWTVEAVPITVTAAKDSNCGIFPLLIHIEGDATNLSKQTKESGLLTHHVQIGIAGPETRRVTCKTWKKEGFYTDKLGPKENLPKSSDWLRKKNKGWPQIETFPEEDIKTFLRALHIVQNATKTHSFDKGTNLCRVCLKNQPRSIYLDKDFGWMWNVGYEHYLIEHRVKPSQNFLKYIETKSNNILSAASPKDVVMNATSA